MKKLKDFGQDTTMESSVTAVVLGHGDRKAVLGMIEQMRAQTKPPKQIIVAVCCMDTKALNVDIVIEDKHKDDWGQRLCDYGLRLADQDYVLFASCDDEYMPTFLEELTKHNEDIIHCDFKSHLLGRVVESACGIGSITRGNFVVKRAKAQPLGYNHRDYNGDGKFIVDMKKIGATDVRVPSVLYNHN